MEGNSASGFDAKDAAGARYQIKARRITDAPGSRQLSAMVMMTTSNVVKRTRAPEP